jgi:hypothetical protein
MNKNIVTEKGNTFDLRRMTWYKEVVNPVFWENRLHMLNEGYL